MASRRCARRLLDSGTTRVRTLRYVGPPTSRGGGGAGRGGCLLGFNDTVPYNEGHTDPRQVQGIKSRCSSTQRRGRASRRGSTTDSLGPSLLRLNTSNPSETCGRIRFHSMESHRRAGSSTQWTCHDSSLASFADFPAGPQSILSQVTRLPSIASEHMRAFVCVCVHVFSRTEYMHPQRASKRARTVTPMCIISQLH